MALDHFVDGAFMEFQRQNSPERERVKACGPKRDRKKKRTSLLLAPTAVKRFKLQQIVAVTQRWFCRQTSGF